jgi:colanic acid/amylovoran biosynthesis glycosyltransferase
MSPPPPVAAPPPARIIYLVKMYPRFSETFILNEILGLQELGVDVQVYSLRFPTDGKFHDGLSRVMRPVRYVPEFLASQFREFAAAWLWAIRKRPIRFMQTLADAVIERSLDAIKRWAQGIWLCREFADSPQQAIHVHFLDGAAHAAYFLNRLNGNPYTVTAHAYDIYTSGKNFVQARRIAECSRGIVTVCEYNRRYLVRKLGPSNAGRFIASTTAST